MYGATAYILYIMPSVQASMLLCIHLTQLEPAAMTGYLSLLTYMTYCLYVQAKELETELDAALIAVEDQISVESCKDHDVSRTALGKHLYRSNQIISM